MGWITFSVECPHSNTVQRSTSLKSSALELDVETTEDSGDEIRLNIEHEIIDEWRLSDDGKVLTQTTTYRINNGIEFGLQGGVTPAGPKSVQAYVS